MRNLPKTLDEIYDRVLLVVPEEERLSVQYYLNDSSADSGLLTHAFVYRISQICMVMNADCSDLLTYSSTVLNKVDDRDEVYNI